MLAHFRNDVLSRATGWLLAGVLATWSCAPAWALPDTPQVTHGAVTFEQQGNILVVNQATGRAVVQYGSFNIGAGETVRFVQPGASSAILNRVVGGGGSVIAGRMQANGDVYLINPAGILFTPSAQVNVHGLVASAMHMSDGDFLAGNLNFTGPGGSVVNQGSLNGAFVYLVGGSVENQGSINAGQVALAAGQSSVQIGNAGGGQIQLIIDGEDQSAAGSGTEESADGQGDDGQDGAADQEAAATDDTGADQSVEASQPGGGAEGATADGTVADTGDDSATTSGETDEANPGETMVEVEDVPVGNDSANPAEGAAPEADAVAGTEPGADAGSAVESGDVINQGAVTATPDPATGQGGSVAASGRRVAQLGRITANTEVGDAGEIAVHAQEAVVLGRDSVTSASAERIGDGGTIVLTSEASTYIDPGAVLQARGGSESGDGGFVETSGETGLYVGRAPDVRAVSVEGKTGTWRIDPRNVSIEDTPGMANENIDTVDAFWTAVADAAVVDVNQLKDTVEAGGYVSVETGGGGAEAGDINVNTPIDFGSLGAFQGRLDLRAHNDVNVLNPIRAGEGSIDILLEADRDSSGAGRVRVAADIVSGGGDIRATGNRYLQDANIDTGGGNLTIVTVEDVEVNGGIDARGGDNNHVTINAVTGVIDLRNGSSIAVDGNGSICVTGNRFVEDSNADITADGVLSVENGELVLLADNALTIFPNADIRATGAGKILIGSRGGAVSQTGGRVQSVDGDIVSFADSFDQSGGRIETTGAGDVVMTVAGPARFAGEGVSGNDVVVQATGDITASADLTARGDLLLESVTGQIQGGGVLTGDRVGLKALGDIGSEAVPLEITAATMLLIDSVEGVPCVKVNGAPATEGTIDYSYSVAFECANASSEFFPKPGNFIPIEGDPQTADAIFIPTPSLTIVGKVFTPKTEDPDPERPRPTFTPIDEPTPPRTTTDPEPTPPEPVPTPVRTPAPPPPPPPAPVAEPPPPPPPPPSGPVRVTFDPADVYILDTVLAGVSDEQPLSRDRAIVFNEFYFLHQAMQSSEYSMKLDLNFIDYLVFGSARITPNAKFPVEVKDRIYIGGERPFQIFGTNPGVIQY